MTSSSSCFEYLPSPDEPPDMSHTRNYRRRKGDLIERLIEKMLKRLFRGI